MIQKFSYISRIPLEWSEVTKCPVCAQDLRNGSDDDFSLSSECPACGWHREQPKELSKLSVCERDEVLSYLCGNIYNLCTGRLFSFQNIFETAEGLPADDKIEAFVDELISYWEFRKDSAPSSELLKSFYLTAIYYLYAACAFESQELLSLEKLAECLDPNEREEIYASLDINVSAEDSIFYILISDFLSLDTPSAKSVAAEKCRQAFEEFKSLFPQQRSYLDPPLSYYVKVSIDGYLTARGYNCYTDNEMFEQILALLDDTTNKICSIISGQKEI